MKLKVFYIILQVVIFLVISPFISFGVITLPFQTTFDCDEWYGPTDGGGAGDINCDGMGGVPNYSVCTGEQITLDANMATGGGGRGHRQAIHDRHNSHSGGMWYFWDSSINGDNAVAEIWIRYYFRFESGFVWVDGDPVFKKMTYINNGKPGAATIGFAGNGMYNTYNSGGDPVETPAGCSIACYSYNANCSPASNCPTDNLDQWTTNMGWFQVNDGKWHLLEQHFKRGSTGYIHDGEFNFWLDGNLVARKTTVDWNLDGGWYKAQIPSNQSLPDNNSCSYVDIDDMEIVSSNPGSLCEDENGDDTLPCIGPLKDFIPISLSPPLNFRIVSE